MLYNVTIDYFYSQLFWFFLCFFCIYISFTYFLCPAVEKVLTNRLEKENTLDQEIQSFKLVIEQNELELDDIKKNAQKQIIALKHDCITQIQNITNNYNNEYKKEKKKLISKMLKEVDEFLSSEAYKKIQQEFEGKMFPIIQKYL